MSLFPEVMNLYLEELDKYFIGYLNQRIFCGEGECCIELDGYYSIKDLLLKIAEHKH